MVCVIRASKIQSKVDPPPFGYLHIPWNLSITTSINEIQATASVLENNCLPLLANPT